MNKMTLNRDQNYKGTSKSTENQIQPQNVSMDKNEFTFVDSVCQGQKLNRGKEPYGSYQLTSETEKNIRTETSFRWKGHWGWMCVVGSFFIHAIIQGCFGKSSGIMQLIFEDKFQASTADTTWVFSICMALQMLLGPLASTVCNIFSCRTATMAGGIIFMTGLLVSAFSTSIWLLYISYGVVGGIGSALAYGPAIVIIGSYFRDKSGFPIGLASSGSGFGSFVFPLLIELMFDSYSYTGALMLLSGIALNLSLCGSLFRPVAMKESAPQRQTDEEPMKKQEPTGKSPTKQYARFSSIVLDKPIIIKPTVKEKKKIFNHKILKNPTFLLFCTCLGLTSVNRIFHFIPSLTTQKGMNKLQIASLLSISGICETISRITSGITLELKWIRSYRLFIYNLMLYSLALMTFTFPYMESFIIFAVISGLYGILMGAIASQKSIVLMDILGPQFLCDGNGVLAFFRGIGVLVGPPLLGLLKDTYGGYKEAFFLGGSFTLCGSICFSTGLVLFYRKKKFSFDFKIAEIQRNLPEQYKKF